MWAKDNTGKNSIFMTGSQCISYHISRQTASPQTNNIKNADYAFVSQDFRLDRRALIEDDLLSEVKKNGKLDYSNEKTDTQIYKISK